MKKEEWKKEIGEALGSRFECPGVELIGYAQDGSMAHIEFKVSIDVNGDVSDLFNGYKKGEPESEYIMSILNSKKKMDWKEFDKVRKELMAKGYRVDWNEYYEDEPVTEEVSWNIPPKEFAYEIVRVGSDY